MNKLDREIRDIANRKEPEVVKQYEVLGKRISWSEAASKVAFQNEPVVTYTYEDALAWLAQWNKRYVSNKPTDA